MAIDVIPKNETTNKKTLEEFIKIYWQALCPIPKNNNPAWQNNETKDNFLIIVLMRICIC